MFDGVMSIFKTGFVIMIFVFAIIIILALVKSQEDIDKSKGQTEKENERERTRGIITDDDKQQLLSRGGNNLLTFTLTQYQQAINGDASAMVAMGAIYQSKLNNEYKAVYWYERAHKGGDWEGTYWLGECHRSGYGVERDGIIAMSYIREAAQHGNENAINYFKDRGMTKEQAKQYGIPIVTFEKNN